MANRQALPRMKAYRKIVYNRCINEWFEKNREHARQLAAIGKTTCLYQAIITSLLQATCDKTHHIASRLDVDNSCDAIF